MSLDKKWRGYSGTVNFNIFDNYAIESYRVQ